MPYFIAKVHQIRFWLGVHPDPTGGAYSAPQTPVAGFKGPTSKRKERTGRGKGGEGKE